jgi:hypothetical protein
MSDTYLYRCNAFGSPIGSTMNAHEVVSLIAGIRAHAAAGLAEPGELRIERRDSDGWHLDFVIDNWEAPPEFSNPVADDG